jgi:hypothetical protein
MSGSTRTTGTSGKGLPSTLSGKEVVALIRKHKVTIEFLAFRIGTSMKPVRKVREIWLQDVLFETGYKPYPARIQNRFPRSTESTSFRRRGAAAFVAIRSTLGMMGSITLGKCFAL